MTNKKNDDKKAYVPRFSAVHTSLLGMYKDTMRIGMTDYEGGVFFWRAKSAFDTLRMLKEDGILPPLFTKNFHEDIQGIIDFVRKENGYPDISQFSDAQKILSVDIATLRSEFGGK